MKSYTLAPLLIAAFAVGAGAQSPAPLQPVARHSLPADVTGHFDHLTADVPGNRLFLAAESTHSVLILNLRTGKYEGRIADIKIPHAMFLRRDLNRLFITDGGAGGVKVVNATTYKPIAFIPLNLDTDSIAYDPQTKYLYVVSGGGDAHQTFSMYSVIDTTTDKKLADIKLDGDTLEASVIDPDSARIFLDNPAKNQVDVINRKTRTLAAAWPIKMARENVAIALDAASHRLFVACRSGKIVVLDSRSGKELQTLDIGKGVDDLIFDAATKRIYAAGGAGKGETAVYEEKDPDHYTLLGAITTAPGAKNEVLVPQLERYFTIAPPGPNSHSAVLEYKVQR